MISEKTYCTNLDVERRLRLGEFYGNNTEELCDVRGRAHRWIRSRYAHRGKTAPKVDEELDDAELVLRDIEADHAAYLYIRDKMEWASEPASTLTKMNNWRDESTRALELLFRTKWGDELYYFKTPPSPRYNDDLY